MIVFVNKFKTISFICTGGPLKKNTRKRNLRVSISSMCIFPFKNKYMKQYSTNILKSNTSSSNIIEKVYHWLDSFEKFHKKYIIMPSESLNYSLLEEILFIAVWSPPVFINQENETRCYLNSTINLLYFNVIFRHLILNIYCYNMMIGLD